MFKFSQYCQLNRIFITKTHTYISTNTLHACKGGTYAAEATPYTHRFINHIWIFISIIRINEVGSFFY